MRKSCILLVLLGVLASWAMAEPPSDLSIPSPSQGPFTADQASCPETVVFLLMRSVSAFPSRQAELRDQIDHWRAMAHDRRRKVGDEWLWPRDFKARRTLFLDRLKGAQDALKGHGLGGSAGKNDVERQRAQNAANDKYRAAAGVWLDPLLRSYLQGLAAMNTKSAPRSSEGFLQQCVRVAPQVGGFQQAYGLALLANNRPLDAVEAMSVLLRLQSDSREALAELRDAAKKVPGVQIKSSVYLKAQDLLSEYDVSPGSPGGGSPGAAPGAANAHTYLMPGKPWVIHDPVLVPAPPYDRLVFRQAPAVPVGPRTLLVDAQVLSGALEVYVQVDALTLVAAKVKPLSAVRGKKLPPLALLTVTDYEFTPLEGEKKTAFAPLTHATIYASDLYREMGPKLRQVPTRIKSVDPAGNVTLSAAIAPGEAAAPVVTTDDRIVGFLAARTDAGVDQGGPDKLIALPEILPFLEQARKATSGSHGTSGAHGLRPTVTTRPAKGTVFMVRVTSSEGPEK